MARALSTMPPVEIAAGIKPCGALFLVRALCYQGPMAIVRAEAQAVVSASPEETFRAITDLESRPRYLPSAYSQFRVESDERGNGSVISFSLTAGGRTRTYRMRSSESADGVLTESDLDSSLVTTYTVSAAQGGSRVEISTTWQGAGGIGGFFERTFAPRVLARVYSEELQLLDAYLRSAAGGAC